MVKILQYLPNYKLPALGLIIIEFCFMKSIFAVEYQCQTMHILVCSDQYVLHLSISYTPKDYYSYMKQTLV